ncbi:MAG: ankyrin repeat domain-containing protein [Treponema sp.]|nr:ankyrin repeat domain-containing protein [Treponema sp.]
MKWLIVSSDMTNQNLLSVEDFLDEKDASYKEIFINSETTKLDFLKYIKDITESTHCIILDSCVLYNLPNYAILLGILLGKKIKTFICTAQKYEREYEKASLEGQTFFRCFEELKSLLQYVRNNYELFAIASKQYESFSILFKRGIPFNGDCFAQHIAKDDTEVCDLFLSAGMISNATTEDGVPMICIATRNDCFEKVKWLVDNGADINAVSKDRGYTAVMDAVWRKNYPITEYLIKKGADLSVISSDGQSILVLAVGNGNPKIVKILLENGADPDVKDGMGMSARGYANLFKRKELMELMELFPPKEN